jgi:hypothetical protein
MSFSFAVTPPHRRSKTDDSKRRGHAIGNPRVSDCVCQNADAKTAGWTIEPIDSVNAARWRERTNSGNVHGHA